VERQCFLLQARNRRKQNEMAAISLHSTSSNNEIQKTFDSMNDLQHGIDFKVILLRRV